MKKVLIVILALLLILGGLFFWKGGHHALVLAGILEEYADTDNATQAMTVQVQIPGARVNPDNGRLEAHVEQYMLTCDTFWTEYADHPLLGLTAQGVTAYTDGKTLFMDTGKAYALPELSGLRKTARKLALGLLLSGRITRHGDVYSITMKTGELQLDADLTADKTLRSGSMIAMLPDDSSVVISITAKDPVPHTVPRAVLDSMVRTKMEPPMALTEPLEVLLPALENLLPLSGDLSLGVECGILELAETVALRMDKEKAEIERKGVIVTLDLPVSPAQLQPLPAALLLLRNGAFTLDGDDAQIEITLPPDTTGALCAALVPQIESLGMSFTESRAVLTITDGRLQAMTLNAGGEVPFLVTTIPLTFTAELNI